MTEEKKEEEKEEEKKEQPYYLAHTTAYGDFELEEFDTGTRLASRIREMLTNGGEFQGAVFRERIMLSKKPRHLLLPEGAIPLFDAPEKPEPDDGTVID